MAETLLVNAAKANDLEGVRHRLECGDDIEEKLGNDTALIWAACNGQTEIVRLLIDWGANLSVTTGSYTPYTLAKNSHPETAAVIAAAVQQPRRLTGPREDWVEMGASTVAFVGSYPKIEKKLTQVFNFETRERLLLSENLRTRAEALAPPVCFDDLPQGVLEKALDAFARLGGKADRDFVLHGGNTLNKIRKISSPG